MAILQLLRHLFKRQQAELTLSSRQPDTQPDLYIPQPDSSKPKPQPMSPPYLRVSCAQSVGRQRDINEDSIFTFTISQTNEGAHSPIGLFIVADGMGGHEHGERASRLATQVTAHAIMDKLNHEWLTPVNEWAEKRQPVLPSADALKEILSTSIQEAHRVVHSNVPGGGTTLSALLIYDRLMAIAHVGDTRIYALAPDGSRRILTRDHSLVSRLVELGQITPAEAAVHPQRNVLYRALGQGEPFEIDLSAESVPEAGYLLLCTDGLWGLVAEADLSRYITEATTLQDACQHLIDEANRAGGHDNISAILIAVPSYA